MARDRIIRAETFDDPDLNRLPLLARWLFVGLWTLADREGRLEDEPRRIKVRLLPYDKADCDKLLTLLTPKFITRYSVNGCKVIQINNFSKHQRIHPHEGQSTLPEHVMTCHDMSRQEMTDQPGQNQCPCTSTSTSTSTSVPKAGADAPAATVTDEALTDEPAPPKPKRPPDSDVARFIVWWTWGYERFRGHPYQLVRPKDPATIARLLHTFSLPRLKQMAMFLWHDQADEWIGKTDRGIGILSTCANRLADWIAEQERQTKRPCEVAPEPEVSDATS